MPRRIISLVPTMGVAVLAVAGLLAVVPTTSVGLQMGIGDNNPKMFGSPYYRALYPTISRYVAPYDVADRPSDLAAVNAWITAAEAQHVEPLVAFYHSRSRPNQLPSVARYALEIKRFIALKRACPLCTVVGLDVLDSTNVASTIRYIHAFQHDVHGRLPSIWGLHNYS